jgi:hypothetical protein
MKKYFLMAIDKGNIGTMNTLARYYEMIEKNNVLASKYYLIENESKENKCTEYDYFSSLIYERYDYEKEHFTPLEI